MAQIPLLFSVATLWALAVVSPGPNFLVTARLAIASSRHAGLEAVSGIALGTVAWAAAGCFGVRTLFIAAPWMDLALKAIAPAISWPWAPSCFGTAGATAASFRASRNGARNFAISARAHDHPRQSPSVSVASIFATAMPSHPSLMLSLAVMTMMVTISVSWYALIASLFAAPALADGYRRFRRWIDRAAGACLVLFGAKLAVEP